VTVIGAMGPPGGGRQPVSNRMLRLMHMISFTDMTSDEIESIFTTITAAFIKFNVAEEMVPMANSLVKATVTVYNQTCDSLRPTPEKPHYTFNLRDVSKVVQGVLMADKRRPMAQPDIVRLWAHECCRVFSDRLISAEDRSWFLDQVNGGHFRN
jgi:dynein heavy chain